MVDVFDPRRVTQHALQTATSALQAYSGALYLELDGERRLVHTCGSGTQPMSAWRSPSRPTVNSSAALNLAARQDGTPYGAHDREVLRQTLSEVGLAIYLASAQRQPIDDLDEW